MAGPQVSVVLPTYNRADVVGRAIESVLAQTLADFELIVVDDASQDETPSVVQSYEDDRLTYVRHVENTYGRAWNTGIDHATAPYIAFIDDDDEWYPEKLERQVACFEAAAEDVALVYCWREVYEYGERVNVAKPEVSGDIFDRTIVHNPIGNTSTFMIEASALDVIGGFDESLPCGLDSDLLRRLSREYAVDYVPAVLVKQHWKHGDEQISADDDESRYESIESHRATIDKFESYLNGHPARRVALYRAIADLYVETGDYAHALAWAGRMATVDPLAGHTRRELWSFWKGLLGHLGVARYLPNPRRFSPRHGPG